MIASPRRVRLAALAASLALLGLAPTASADGPPVMDRLAALFVQGRPIGFQLVFETLDTTDDLDVNTTLAEVKELNDPSGRHLALFTSSYLREGAAHRFMFVIRDGELIHVDLQRRAGERWERAPADVFSFQSSEDPPPPDFLGEGGDAVLVLRGYCTPSRGVTARKPAVLVLRSFHTAEGKPPAY